VGDCNGLAAVRINPVSKHIFSRVISGYENRMISFSLKGHSILFLRLRRSITGMDVALNLVVRFAAPSARRLGTFSAYATDREPTPLSRQDTIELNELLEMQAVLVR
jgi:hypothetical protein